ncbi:Yet3p KNAG_0D04430 [Huiozyma naganishii CBS 8797]|uniref:Endoplasmic reticulum transmembrane protein n=1 Tax=Huiozyma naganishii (strain ATCC MYA-139 / BCRC 22969 / CBS 8797 / KCTC 17520 / NBRC 10181 / NCYC 3082 / Yp74L-3) TaxID=1071383 RepID=J7RL11_HUIN7|nr:hypothetical protein KNAG_0D04430 [Kazachstania naganishii CBS 8797]CCK70188.1 hypothetical protein KNAG_0D04430 [Kazachstania naganishii CBS 8797]
MSLYYSLIFVILVIEISMFSLLAMPIPTKFRKPLTYVLIKPFRYNTVTLSAKCVIAFILLLFLDSINKVYNIDTRELSGPGGIINPAEKIEVYSRKFLQQRNMYLTGITLFLTFVVVRTFALVQELIDLKQVYRADAQTPAQLKARIADAEKQIKAAKERAAALD